MNDLHKHMATAGIITLIMIACSTAALASPVLDQSQELSNGGSAFFHWVSLAQTFTPGINGDLDHVDLKIEGFNQHDVLPATISIVETVAEAPSGSILGSVVNASISVGWNSIDFASQSITLLAGTKYGIVLSNADSNKDISPTDSFRIQWDSNPYASGALWERTRNSSGGWNDWEQAVFDTSSTPGYADGAFRTYMVPEPASLALLLGPALLAGLRSKRKVKKTYRH
ncbi:MAG: hypothetical protein GWP14_09560 [Actinobacteria bacterium]|nr:hypothetical protein [Actinomycetota bacterium]